MPRNFKRELSSLFDPIKRDFEKLTNRYYGSNDGGKRNRENISDVAEYFLVMQELIDYLKDKKDLVEERLFEMMGDNEIIYLRDLEMKLTNVEYIDTLLGRKIRQLDGSPMAFADFVNSKNNE